MVKQAKRKNRKKIIKLEIEEEDFPLLFKMDKLEIADMCYKIFENGYNLKFPDVQNNNNNANQNQNDLTIIKNMVHHTDSIKGEIKLINDKIKTDEINTKLDQFSDIIEQMFGISSNSSKKGRVTEEIIYSMIKLKFSDYSLDETRGMSHRGDAIINIPKHKKINKLLLEIKNYSHTVDTDEIDKLRYDMKHNDLKYSVFVSIKSGFVGKKYMEIEEFKYNDAIYTILYVPNLFDDLSKLESAIVMMDKLMDYNTNKTSKTNNIKWLENSVTSNLTKLDTLYTEYNSLKNSFFKMEKVVKQSIHDHFSVILNYENLLKKKINDTWDSINKDFGEAKKSLLGTHKHDIIDDLKSGKYGRGNKNLIRAVEILLKHGMHITHTSSKNLYHIHAEEDDLFGSIMKDSKKIQISINEPKMKFDFDARKKINSELMMLDKIMTGLELFS
jgi:hypothetical protein